MTAQGFLSFYSRLNQEHIDLLSVALEKSSKTRCGATGCLVSLLKDTDTDKAHKPPHCRGNPRMGIPKHICNDLGLSIRTKKPVTWIVCVVNNILPVNPQSECSHRCTLDDCITPECLVWEARAANQSRGATGTFGQRLCTTDDGNGNFVCETFGFHDPPCRRGPEGCTCNY